MISSENYDTLYHACQTGDVATVKRILPLLSFEELHHRLEQTQFFGFTPSLITVAWSAKNQHIAQYLVEHGVMRSMKTKLKTWPDAQQQLHSADPPPTMSSLRDRLSMDVPIEEAYEWLTTSHAHVAPLNRGRMSERSVVEVANSIREDPRFRDITNIQFYLDKACQTQNPEYLIKVYTASGDFFAKINQAFASDKGLGFGMNFLDEFTGIYLYSGCLLHNKYLKKFRYGGTTYRGIQLNQEYFDINYIIGHKAMIRPFTSTSKSREVAAIFADPPAPAGKVSVLCIFTIPNDTVAGRYATHENLALDISSISVIPDEEEVLILPHISFEIVNIIHLSTGLIEVTLNYFGF